MNLRYLDLTLSEYSRIQHLLDEMQKPESNSTNFFKIYLDRCELILSELSDDLDKVAERSYKVT